jgi:UDP-N-acetylglucosamine--N-acetylmuramyl-(pentapeptide) pyrophosphoryl-undecaprenol N-acetylglucosamine transferase
VIHVTGPSQGEIVRASVKEHEAQIQLEAYTQVDFLDADAMADAYAVADLLIARPGSGTIAEIAANKKPSILIPHPSSANDHQRMNAFAVAEAGATLVLDEDNLGEHILQEKIAMMLSNTDVRKQFAENIAIFYFKDAPAKIVAGIMQMLR